MQVKLRTVTGRAMAVDVETGATVKEVLAVVCKEYGYRQQGSKLVVKGDVTLKEDTEVAGVSEKVLTFVGVKATYKSKEERAKEGEAPASTVSPARSQAGGELDLSLPQYDGPFDMQHRQGVVQLRNALQKIPESEVTDLLFIHPTVMCLRTLVQSDSSLLAPAMGQIHAIAPEITEMIQRHAEPFVALLNDPVNPRADDGVRGSDDDEDDFDFQAMAGELTPDDIEALNRIQDLGPFPRDLVLHAFLDAGRNEHLAAQYLLDLAAYDPIVFAPQPPPPPQESEADVLRGRLAAAEEAKDDAAVLDAVADLGMYLAREGDADCEAMLHRAVRLALLRSADDADRAGAVFDACYASLSAYYKTSTSGKGSAKEIILHEAAALMDMARRGVSARHLLEGDDAAEGAGALTIERLTAVAAKEGVDLVLVHCKGDQLVVWQVKHRATPEAPEEAVVRQRCVQLPAADADLMASATEELNTALAQPAQKGWTLLHRLHQIVFGCEGCGSWMPTKVSFCSTLLLPFHALSPHGGVPLSRGRQITQNTSVLSLEAHQRLAVKPLASRGRRRQLRSVYVGNAPGYVANKNVAVSELEEGESVMMAHFGNNTTGGETRTTLGTSADVAVYSCGVGGDPTVATYDAARGVWACSSLVYILDPAPLAGSGGPAAGGVPRPKRDQHLLLQAFHRALPSETKVHAYSLALAANPDTHIRAWVPWVLTGTRLLLGGRRAHIRSEKLKATDDYRYLEAHSMHIVFDKMIGHLLEGKPDDPVDSLLAYMEASQEELEAIGRAKDE